MKKISILLSIGLFLIIGVYTYRQSMNEDLEVLSISNDIINDYKDIIIKSGNNDEKVIALTFDDGPDRDFTPQVLDILKKNDVKATFFVVGENVEWNPEILKRQYNEGHEIGNHGHRHLDYAKLSYEENLEQIKTSKKIIEDIINEKTKFFQAPAGSFGEGTIKAANELGYTSIKWDIDTIDWNNRKEPDVIIERVKKKDIKDGSIVLMHPTYATTQCLDDIIQIIKDKGLKAGMLSNIF